MEPRHPLKLAAIISACLLAAVCASTARAEPAGGGRDAVRPGPAAASTAPAYPARSERRELRRVIRADAKAQPFYDTLPAPRRIKVTFDRGGSKAGSPARYPSATATVYAGRSGASVRDGAKLQPQQERRYIVYPIRRNPDSKTFTAQPSSPWSPAAGAQRAVKPAGAK